MEKHTPSAKSPLARIILQEWREEQRKRGHEEGMMIGTRDVTRRVGTKLFGSPSPEIMAQLEAVATLLELESMKDRLLAIKSWDELFGGSKP